MGTVVVAHKYTYEIIYTGINIYKYIQRSTWKIGEVWIIRRMNYINVSFPLKAFNYQLQLHKMLQLVEIGWRAYEISLILHLMFAYSFTTVSK